MRTQQNRIDRGLQDQQTQGCRAFASSRCRIDLLGGNTGLTALITAARVSEENTVKLLLHRGATIVIEADKEATALIMASLRGREVNVNLLLGRDTDINLQTRWTTAVLVVASNRQSKVVELLLDRGADVSI